MQRLFRAAAAAKAAAAVAVSSGKSCRSWLSARLVSMSPHTHSTSHKGFAAGISSSSRPTCVRCRACSPSPEKCGACGVFPCNKINAEKFERQARTPNGRPMLWLAGAIGLFGLISVEEVPVTERWRPRLIPGFISRRSAATYDEEIEQQLGDKALPSSSAEYRFVKAVGDRLAAANNIDGLEYYVIPDDSEENAFVSAGGKVLVYTGLLRVLDTPDRLAIVLGHELAHYVAEHVKERDGVNWIRRGIRSALGVGSAESIDKATAIALSLPMSRALEEEADHIGLVLVARACFDISQAQKVWELLHGRRREQSSSSEHDHPNTAAFLEDNFEPNSLAEELWSTHPTHRHRIDCFQPNGPWMQEAAAEQTKYCVSCAKHDSPLVANAISSIPLWVKYTRAVLDREN